MEIQYRKGTIEDLEDICELVASAIRDMEQQGIHQWDGLYPAREDFQEDIARGELSVGRTAGRLAVVYVLNQQCDEEYRDGRWSDSTAVFCVVHRLCVHPSFQHRGIAAQTLKHIEQEAAERKAQYIRLDVFSQNLHAIRLYESAGFRRAGHADWRVGRFWLMEKAVPSKG